jgi:hypothetical protein
MMKVRRVNRTYESAGGAFGLNLSAENDSAFFTCRETHAPPRIINLSSMPLLTIILPSIISPLR